MDAKKLFLQTEGDNYYQRNKNALHKGVDIGTQFYASFLENEVKNFDENTKIVEIGASNGRNLNYFIKKLGCVRNNKYKLHNKEIAVRWQRLHLLFYLLISSTWSGMSGISVAMARTGFMWM